jgi:hypothetical protein
MRKLAITALCAVAPLCYAAPAQADYSDCATKLERQYSHNYHKVANRLGERAPGRNIRKKGVLFRGTVFNATCGEVRRSLKQLKKLLTPPAYAYIEDVAPAQPPAGVRTPEINSVGGSSNSMVNPSCESGGNPQALSPDGTYWGWYQFDYTTWVAHGGNPGDYGSAPLYIQHQVAAKVEYDAWPNC